MLSNNDLAKNKADETQEGVKVDELNRLAVEDFLSHRQVNNINREYGF